jgi:bifunctional DNA-binding transcriptional regulator/antitoxin component of YhaV-PrlF toxin-antitoxin module
MKSYGPYRIQKNFSVVTVPEEVRKILEVGAGDFVVWIIDDTGRCVLRKAKIEIEGE